MLTMCAMLWPVSMAIFIQYIYHICVYRRKRQQQQVQNNPHRDSRNYCIFVLRTRPQSHMRASLAVPTRTVQFI